MLSVRSYFTMVLRVFYGVKEFSLGDVNTPKITKYENGITTILLINCSHHCQYYLDVCG